MPPSAVPTPTSVRARRRLLGEVFLGLLLGAVAGWTAGLLRVRRP